MSMYAFRYRTYSLSIMVILESSQTTHFVQFSFSGNRGLYPT